MADSARRSSWIGVWTRAVVGPAARRGVAVWIGCGLVAAITFGGNGIRPHDLTHLALTDPPVGVALAAIWLLVFLPVARAIVRAPGATYLRSLPHAPLGPIVVGTAALIGLQLPWLVLWTLGEGAPGLGVLAATTAIGVALAAVAVSPRHPRWPGWSTAAAALAGIHLRASVRLAGDTIARGIGLAALGGVTAGLFVRNNAVVGTHAALIGTSVMLVILVPARAGMLLVVLDSHRRASWIADSLGIGPASRSLAIVRALAVVHGAAIAVALGAAALVARPDAPTLAGWIAIALGAALVSAVAEAGAIVRVQHRAAANLALVVGSVAVAGLGVLALGLFGVAGLAGLAAVAAVAVAA